MLAATRLWIRRPCSNVTPQYEPDLFARLVVQTRRAQCVTVPAVACRMDEQDTLTVNAFREGGE